MRIIIFGPQGSGKGTQAELIARRHQLPYISTGDIFRYNIKNETELGKKVSEYTSVGNLVPDELTSKIVKDRVSQPDCEVGFVLDGFPRNVFQQEFLSTISRVNFAFVIEISDEEAVTRLSSRLACKCGLSYHLQFNPPTRKDQCDKCDGVLFRRDDDNPEAIKNRLEIYHKETEPIYQYYDNLNVLYKIDGSRAINEVFKDINDKIVK